MSDSWESKGERAGIFWIRLLVWIALVLGRRAVNLVLLPISLFYYLVAKDAVEASKKYQEKILGRLPSWKEVWRHFYTFAVVSVDRFFFLKGRYEKFNVHPHGAEVFESLMEESRGCIILVSHIGSFDALRALGVAYKNLPLKILMDHKHNPAAMKIIDALNPDLASAIVDSGQPPAKLALELSEHLQGGGMIGIMADRLTKGEASIECDFLGGKVNLPLSPWQLTAVLKVPVVLCFGLFEGGNKYSIYIEQLSDGIIVKRSERKEKLQEYSQSYLDRISFYIKKAPHNWFNFYDFWK